MSSPEPQKLSDMRVDAAYLYREEIFTDLKIATLRRMTPIKVDGSPDPTRPALYVGQTNVMTGGGMLPIEVPIEAASLEEAMTKFPEAAQEAVQEMIAQVREMQRQEASRIVVPRPGSLPPGGMPPAPGTGKIRLT
jgi:hypothetical protein